MKITLAQRKTIIITIITILLLIALNIAIIKADTAGISVDFKTYTTNIFGWEATHVRTIVNAILATSNTFDTFNSYTTREAWHAWWCLTCYAHANPEEREVSGSTVGEDTGWDQGSWNAQWKGANHVEVKAVGDYKVSEKVYYEVNSSQSTVVDAIKDAIKFITDILSRLIGSQ